MMSRVGLNGYLIRNTHGGKRNPTGKGCERDWWLVKYKHNTADSIGTVSLSTVSLPHKYVGKKVRFKIEVMG